MSFHCFYSPSHFLLLKIFTQSNDNAELLSLLRLSHFSEKKTSYILQLPFVINYMDEIHIGHIFTLELPGLYHGKEQVVAITCILSVRRTGNLLTFLFNKDHL